MVELLPNAVVNPTYFSPKNLYKSGKIGTG